MESFQERFYIQIRRATVRQTSATSVLGDLREELNGMDLPVGISTALSTKLDKAYELVLSGADHPDPVHHLEAFVHFVENHNGTKIGVGDADLLADAALDAVSLLQLDLGSAPAVASVPEPTFGVLMMLGLGLAMRHRRGSAALRET